MAHGRKVRPIMRRICLTEQEIFCEDFAWQFAATHSKSHVYSPHFAMKFSSSFSLVRIQIHRFVRNERIQNSPKMVRS